MRFVTVVIFIFFVVVVESAHASTEGDHQTPRVGAGVSDGVPEAVVVLGPGRVPMAEGETGGSGGTWTCHYYGQVGGEVPEFPGRDEPIAPRPGQYVVLVCYDAEGRIVHRDARYYEPTDPLGGIGAAYRATQLAREQLVLDPPVLELSPPATAFQLVGLPTYLSVGEAWVVRSETASIGAVASTVTATPTRVEWDPGDGAPTITCHGPGSTSDPDCVHTYDRSTRGATLPVTATITWEVAWSATTGEAGSLGTVTRSAGVEVVVAEAQAVIG